MNKLLFGTKFVEDRMKLNEKSRQSIHFCSPQQESEAGM